MSLRYCELQQVVAELGEGLRGAFLQKVSAPAPGWAQLELRQVGRSVMLNACAQPDQARLAIAVAKAPAPPAPLPFQKWLRQELIGAQLEAVELAADDRRAWLRFNRRGEPRVLVLEVSHSAGALVLLGRDEKVLAVSVASGRAREGLRPGARYVPPPSGSEAALSQPSRLNPVDGAPFPLATAAEQLVGTAEQGRRVEDVRRRILAPLKSKLARTERTLEKVRAEAARGPVAEEHRRLGELLSQNLYRLTRGQKEIVLTEYSEEGPREVAVKLDPARSPKEEVEWRFHQYRRLTRGLAASRERLAILERERDELKAELARMSSLTDEQVLSEAGPAPAPREKAGPPVAKPYKEFRAVSGERIWVGKSSEGNDTLTFKVARPQDLWLHARGVPGSHVVVPMERNAQLSQELLLDAAHLALHFSQLKGEPRAEVSYTPVKFVRKQKGGAPGQVIYTREKTLVLRVETARMERLLRSRTDE